MNIPAESDLRVGHEDLRRFVAEIARAAGLPPVRADQLAGMLTDNDLRGVVSHGTVQIATYARLMREGRLNAAPRPRVVRESPVSLVVDGDGGLGYFPAHDGTLAVVEKARSQGMGVVVTRNHGHFGAAGIYARQAVEHGLLAFVTSGVQLDLPAGESLYRAGGGSPMAFAAPTRDEDAVVLDFGTLHDLYDDSPIRAALEQQAPGLVLRAIGMGAICQSWGGLLAGVPIDEARADKRFAGANQGAMVIVMDVGLFTDPDDFAREMDAYVRAVRDLTPLPGFDRAYLPGGVEADRERRHREHGIPIGREHEQALIGVADELGVEVPWGRE